MYDNSLETIHKILEYCGTCQDKLDLKVKNTTDISVLENCLEQLLILRDIINICQDDFIKYAQRDKEGN